MFNRFKKIHFSSINKNNVNIIKKKLCKMNVEKEKTLYDILESNKFVKGCVITGVSCGAMYACNENYKMIKKIRPFNTNIVKIFSAVLYGSLTLGGAMIG